MRITPVTLTVTASPAAPTVTRMAGVRKTPEMVGDSSEQPSVCSREAHRGSIWLERAAGLLDEDKNQDQE